MVVLVVAPSDWPVAVAMRVAEPLEQAADSGCGKERQDGDGGSSGMAVDVALDGAAALDKAAVTAYDVIVLDRDLPVVHGDEVCRRLAQEPVRILMLTAARAVPDRIEGLAMGADDYLPKPARVSASWWPG